MQAVNPLILVASGAHLEPRTYGPAANTALEVDRDQPGSSTDGEGSVAAARLPPKFHFAKIRRFLVNWASPFHPGFGWNQITRLQLATYFKTAALNRSATHPATPERHSKSGLSLIGWPWVSAARPGPTGPIQSAPQGLAFLGHELR